MTTYYVDLEGGNDANDGLSFANRKLTWSGIDPATGADEIRVMRTRDPYSLGDATFTDNTQTIVLASAKTATVDNCDAAWTASANVTATAATTGFQTRAWKEGTAVARLAVGAAFTTGKIAYRALGATLDLSGYTSISMRFARTGVAIAANALRLDLCSDAVGDAPVASLTIPAIASTTAGGLMLFMDYGAALPSNVNSIALYAITDPGTITYELDNIIACQSRAHADHLCHDTLIGKMTGGEPIFYPIRCIDGTTITVGNQSSTPASSGRPYRGASETATLYGVAPARTLVSMEFATDSGLTGDTPMQLSGGWDAATMTVQDGATWVSGCEIAPRLLGAGTGSAADVEMTRINFSGFISEAFRRTTNGFLHVVGEHAVNNAGIVEDLCRGTAHIEIDYMAFNAAFGGFPSSSAAVNASMFVRGKSWFGCPASPSGFFSSSAIQPNNLRGVFEVVLDEIKNNQVGFGAAVTPGGHTRLKGAAFSLNGSDLVSFGQGNLFLDNCAVSIPVVAVQGSCTWRNLNGDPKQCGYADARAFVGTQTSVVPATGDLYAWRLSQGTAAGGTIGSFDRPFRRCIAKIFVEAGSTYTVSFEMRRTNAAMLCGVLADHDGATYRADIAGAINTWLIYSFNFVATADEVVEIDAGIYGTSNNSAYSAYIGNLNVAVS